MTHIRRRKLDFRYFLNIEFRLSNKKNSGHLIINIKIVPRHNQFDFILCAEYKLVAHNIFVVSDFLSDNSLWRDMKPQNQP